MKKRIVLTVQDHAYLIPENQAKDLTALLTQIGAWKRVEKTYNHGAFLLKEDASPSLGINVVDEDDIDGLNPKEDVAVDHLVSSFAPRAGAVEAAKEPAETPF